MKALLVLALVVLLVGGGLKMAGVRLPLIDYPHSGISGPGAGPGMPDVQIEAPGFGDFQAP